MLDHRSGSWDLAAGTTRLTLLPSYPASPYTSQSPYQDTGGSRGSERHGPGHIASGFPLDMELPCGQRQKEVEMQPYYTEYPPSNCLRVLIDNERRFKGIYQHKMQLSM